MPTFVSVEPANWCQLRCPECPVGQRASGKAREENAKSRPRQLLSTEMFRTILGQIERTAHTIQFYFQGEPLLNAALPEMIAMAHQAGLYTIVSTNGQALNQATAERLVASGLRRVIVSIDGFSQESYSAYRIGGRLELAMAGLHYLQEAKQKYRSPIRIELQVLRLSSNEEQWEHIRQHYREWGATHLTFKTAQFYDYKEGNPLMPSEERYSRYRKEKDGLYHLHRREHRSCYRLWSGCVITAGGTVLPCCYDKGAEYAFGHIEEQSLESIWHGITAEAFRRRILHKADRPKMCGECYY